MPRTIESEDLQKHTLNLYKGDFDKLASFYAVKMVPPAQVVRHLVRAHLNALESQLSPNTLEITND